MRLLVTGFGPFPGIPVNPSARLARALAGDPRLKRAGVAPRFELIATTYRFAEAALPEMLDRYRPHAVLMFGVAGRRRHVSIEQLARNRVSILHPDAAGARPARLTIAPGAAPALTGRAPFPALVTAVRAAGLPARLSRDAGTYLCNFAYYRMLHLAGAPTPCLFVHIPRLRGGRSFARMTTAGVAVARLLLRLRRRGGAAPSA